MRKSAMVLYPLTLHDALPILDLIGGYSYQYFTEERFEMANNGFTTDGFKDWNMGAGSALNNTDLPRPSMGSFKQDNKLISFFGRASYSYLERCFAQFILRRDGSYKFGVINKSGCFSVVFVGWVHSE